MKRFMIKDSPAALFEDDVDYSIPAHSDLDQVCEAFTLFLKACGYPLDNQYVTIDFHDDLK